MIQSILACVDTVMLTWCPAFPSPPRWGSRLIVLGALLSPPLQAQELPDASAVIERVLEAYGGVDALAAIESYRMVGELRPVGRSTAIATTRLFSRPDRLRVEIAYPDTPERRVLDGTRGWRERSGSVQPVSGMLLAAMNLQAARADVPWILDAWRDSVRVVGPVERDGRSLIGLELALGPSMLFRAYVDPETDRVVESLGMLLAEGRQVHFVTTYADFRAVEGVVFPFAEENFASGVHTGSTRLLTVEVNPALSADDFRRRP
jgi:hypothetical protein